MRNVDYTMKDVSVKTSVWQIVIMKGPKYLFEGNTSLDSCLNTFIQLI